MENQSAGMTTAGWCEKTYAIVPKTLLGLVTPETLENIARVARKYQIPAIKLTSAQRMALGWIKPEVLDEIWKELGARVCPPVEVCAHYVQACLGRRLCKFGVQDSLGLGEEMEGMLVELELPAKVKVGISGCPRNCSEGYVRDLGIFGRRSGWTVLFGGNAGRRPRIGDIIAEGLGSQDAVFLVKKCLDVYARSGRNKERTARFIERIGIEAFRKAVL
jgi:NAD(P)H-nitrite reductase large subunit